MKKLFKGKRGFAALIPLVLSIGVAIIVLGLVSSLAASTRDTLSDETEGYNTSVAYSQTCNPATAFTNWTCDSAEYNVTSAGLVALLTLSGYWGIIVTIGIFVIILGALMTMFQGGMRR